MAYPVIYRVHSVKGDNEILFNTQECQEAIDWAWRNDTDANPLVVTSCQFVCHANEIANPAYKIRMMN